MSPSRLPRRAKPPRRPRTGAAQKHVTAKLEAAFPVVASGASAGGLGAFRTLLAALPAESGMAFVLVQHLDPSHTSMMVELLSPCTAMPVLEAGEGTRLQPDHVYISPPGRYLAIRDGTVHLSRPPATKGVRMPIDFLLQSLAEELGERAVCLILSGTGTDGSIGAKAIKEAGGLVIAQEPDEAEYDGMPRSAIETGAVDLVLRLAEVPGALATYGRHRYLRPAKRAIPHSLWAMGWQESSICCAKKPRMTLRSTRKARSGAGSSGAWPWPASKTASAIWIC